MLSHRYIKKYINFWSITSIIFVLLIIIPNFNILINIFHKPDVWWFHVKENLLAEYIKNTIIIIFFTGVFSAILGVGLAWIISIYEFPFRKLFSWALILPIAIPPYIAAYTFSGMLSYTGFIQVLLRNNFDIIVNQKYFDIMNIKGTIFIFTLFLYPYVYIITKSFLQKQSASLIESSRLLGRNQLETFLYVGLPLLRPALFGSITLVILEVLNDYGVVSYFNVKTFSTAIFESWRSYNSLDTAIRLSSILMVIVVILVILEKFARGRKAFSHANTKIKPLKRITLKGYKKVLAVLFAVLPFVLGFIVPTIQLLYWSTISYKKVFNIDFLYDTINTITLSLTATLFVVLIALIIANYGRLQKNTFSKITTKTTTIGYSIPGAVIAIAVLMFFISIDRNLFWFYKIINPTTKKLVLTSSIYMLIFAYVLRFLAIGYNSVESGFDKIGLSFNEASRMLGMNTFKTFFKVDIPMLKPAIISASILVFIDVIKELPLTLILRPFNYDTLAIIAHQYANDEMIIEASIPSLFIILISVIATMLLNKVGKKRGGKNVY